MKVVEREKQQKNILAWPLVGLLFNHAGVMWLMRFSVLALLLMAIYFGFVYPDAKQNPFTLAIFWSLFWPFFIVFSMATLGPVFCGICPHSFVGKYLNRIGLNKPLPTWLKKRWIGLALLIGVYWFVLYSIPGFYRSPWNVALFFLLLTVFAWVMFYRYRNMSYCNYLCPIGSLTSAFGKVGFAKLTTDQAHCTGCRTHECVKACEWNLKPYLFEQKGTMGDCRLCMDCSQACNAVDFQLTRPSIQLYQPVKAKETINVWVYFWLFAVITVTMSFRHGIGHSVIKDGLPWNIAGQWLNAQMPIPYFDWVGFLVVVSAILLTFSIIYLSFSLAASLARVNFKTFTQTVGVMVAPIVLINLLGHVLGAFFTSYASNAVNAGFWLIGMDATMSPLAPRGGWASVFSLLTYVSVLWALFVLWKRLALLGVSGWRALGVGFISASAVWFFVVLVSLRDFLPRAMG